MDRRFISTGLVLSEQSPNVLRADGKAPMGVPAIVDAASEYDLKGFLQRGADVVIYSAQNFLGGPTAGLVAGRRDLHNTGDWKWQRCEL